MNVLILDDDTRRHRVLEKYARGELGDDIQVTIVETADEAIAALSTGDVWEFLMLDHDLGGRVYVDSDDPNTGFQVAKYIRENKVSFQRCIIHTLNDEAAHNMASALEGLGKIHLIPVIRMM